MNEDKAYWLQAVPNHKRFNDNHEWVTYGVYSNKNDLDKKVSELKSNQFIDEGSVTYQYLPMWMILELIKKEGVDDKILIIKSCWPSKIKKLIKTLLRKQS